MQIQFNKMPPLKKMILVCVVLLASLSVFGGAGISWKTPLAYAVTVLNTNDPQYTLLAPLPCIPGTGQPCSPGTYATSTDLKGYVLYVFKFAIAAAVFLAVVVITFAGFRYMLEDSVTKKGEARAMINNAVLGLVGALASWLILYTINPQLVKLSLVTLPTLNLTASSTVLSGAAFQNALNRANTNTAINANDAAAAADQTANQNTINSLKTTLLLDSCIDSSGNITSTGYDSTCLIDGIATYQAAQTAIANDIAEQNTQAAIVSMTAAENTFENTNVNSNFWTITGGVTVQIGDTNSTDAETGIQSVDKAYSQALSTIPNGDIADKQTITDQRTFQDSNIVNDFDTNSALYNLNADAVNNWTTSNSTVATNIATANQLITQLQSNTIPQYGTTSNNLLNSSAPLGTLNPTSTLGQQYASANQAKITSLRAAIRALGGTPN